MNFQVGDRAYVGVNRWHVLDPRAFFAPRTRAGTKGAVDRRGPANSQFSFETRALRTDRLTLVPERRNGITILVRSGSAVEQPAAPPQEEARMSDDLRHSKRSARLQDWRNRLSLRTHLLFVVGVAFLPLLLFSVVMVALFAQEERALFQRGAKERTLALLTAVDTELKRSAAALEALAASDRLDSGYLDLFRVDAERVLASRPEWLNIHLAPPSGLQVMNLLRPPGASLHSVIDEDTFLRALRTAKPVVGNLFREPFSGSHVFPVRAPVVRAGEVRYVLTALVRPEVIHQLLTPQGLPRDWVGVVLDENQTIVARTIGPHLVGEPASESLRAAVAEGSSGWFQGNTIEGWPVYTPFNRSPFSSWTVAIGIPVADVDASLHRSLAYLVAFGVALVGSGFVLAWLLSRRTARSLEELASKAVDLGLGKATTQTTEPVTVSGIAEVADLQIAFARTEALIRARSEERDRHEASLRRVDAELRESERRKDHFLAMLGHELRNPLGVISIALELLPEASPGDATVEPRSMIEHQVAHMTKMLEDLFDVSRIAAGRIQMDRSLCDLVAIVRDTVGDYRETLEGNGLKLELTAPGQPLWVMGDRVRLAQVLGNLLQNASKYTDPGGRVDVELREDAGGESATLTVRDTGVGMEPEILKHAFDTFSQADRTIARSRGGLGLGLALVKGLVEAHGGSVRASSEGSGQGTEIEIQLPLGPPLANQPDPIQSSERWEASFPRRILLIEDNEMAVHSMRLYLTNLGHTVEVARSGAEGLAVARTFSPEVVLCDIGLPEIDGYEVVRTLRKERSAEILLVAVTGYGQRVDQRRAHAAGFDEHLTKPVDLDQLHRILERPGR